MRPAGLLAAFWGLCAVAAIAGTSNTQRLLPSDYEAASADLEDESAFTRLIDKLPTFTVEQGGILQEYYVFEGDLLMTRDEVRLALRNARLSTEDVKRVAEDRRKFGTELVVHAVKGKPQYWPVGQRQLTYAVDRASFPDDQSYGVVVSNMAAAAKEWVDACPGCGLSIRHLTALDQGAQEGNSTFIVRYTATPSPYIALAFFPGAGTPKRYLYVFPAYFRTRYNRPGVFRHEIGHILGYRHEQVREGAGCWQAERGEWYPLTDYDRKSVMHYYCGDAETLKLKLSGKDISGHYGLYSGKQPPRMPIEHGLPGDPDQNLVATTTTSMNGIEPPELEQVAPRGRSRLLISFDGGSVIDNMAAVLNRLADEPFLLPTVEAKIDRPGQTPEGLLKASGIPVLNDQFSLLIKKLNGASFDSRRIRLGSTVKLPSLSVKVRSTARTFSPGDKIQQAEKRTILEGWSGKNIREKSVNGLDIVEFDAYDATIDFQNDAELERALLRLTMPAERSLRSWNVIIETEPQSREAGKAFSIPEDYGDRCKGSGTLPSGAEAPPPAIYGYDELLDASADVAALLKPFSEASGKPSVYIVDTRLLANPALSGAMEGNPIPSTAVKWRCRWVPFVKALHHGTHMASIVGSRNGQGFIGLAPTSRLISLPWQMAGAGNPQSLDAVPGREEAFLQMTRQSTDSEGLAVFLIASELPAFTRDVLTDDNVLKNPLTRLSFSRIHRAVYNQRPLLIAAAGQPDRADASGVAITSVSPKAPQDLGDLENVIVVTACTNCSFGGTTLLPSANYGTGQDPLVHLAAPGGRPIPAWISPDGVGAAAGTSPAAAYVAGVSAAMIARYPQVYIQASRVKRRLQLTAWPILPSADPSYDAWSKVAAGTVDYARAQLNPTVSWLKRGGTWEMVRIKRWSESLRLKSELGVRKEVMPENALRILALPQLGAVRQFAGYTDSETEPPIPGLVRRWGPMALENPAVAVELCTGEQIKITTIDELILASFPPGPETSCPPLPSTGPR